MGCGHPGPGRPRPPGTLQVNPRVVAALAAVIIGVPLEAGPSSQDLQLPPVVTVEELPSEPGCRTLATKTCHKTPVIINKKVIIYRY